MTLAASVRVILHLLPGALAVLSICSPSRAQSFAGSTSPDTSVVSDDLPREYKQWLNEDVRWIITPEERAAFLRLGHNQDRDRFIEEFWKRRDPTPDTVENEFKEEHYRRIAYANMHFGWQKVQGWETDRGRIYIFYGPPDSIKVEPVVINGTSARKTEIWRFQSVRNGQELNLRFVDFCGCGDYRLLGKPAYLEMPELHHF